MLHYFFDGGEDGRGGGEAAFADGAAGEVARVRGEDGDAVALAKRGDVLLCHGVFPHAVVHGGGDQNRGACGERRARQEVVGKPQGDFGERIGGAGGDDHDVCRLGEADMFWVPCLG